MRFQQHFSLLILITVFTVASEARALSICEELFHLHVDTATTPGTPLDSLIAQIPLLGTLRQAKPVIPRSTLLDISEYWVTIREGTALLANCNNEDMDQSIYFPIGVILKPIFDLSSSTHPQLTMFLAEYGLYIIVDRRRIAPVRPEDAYFFTDGVGAYDLCINTKERNPSCDPLAVAGKSPAVLSSKYGYAFGRVNPDLGRRTALLATWQSTGESPSEQDIHWLCERFPAGGLFHGGTRPNSDKPQYASVSLSLCAYEDQERKTGLGYKPIKVVTRDNVASYMYETSPTLYLKRADYGGSLFNFVQRNKPLFRSRKDCAEQLKIESFQTIGFSGGLAWDKVVKVELDGGFQKKTTFARDFGPGEAFIISTYLHLRGLEDKLIPSLLHKVNDVWLLARCDEKNVRPTEPTLLRIYNSQLPDGFVELYPDVLQEMYNQRQRRYGGPSLRKTIQNLQDGIIWEHTDYQEYFFWKTVLRDALNDNTKFQSLTAKFPEDQKSYLENFFIHLIMAAVFSSKTSPPPCAACTSVAGRP
jgi:hypothetical protein